MAFTMYGEIVVANEGLDTVIKYLQIEKKATIIETKPATYNDIYDISKLSSLARYAADNQLYTTVLFKHPIDEHDFECALDMMV